MTEEKKKKGLSTKVKVLLGCGGCVGILVVGGLALSALGLIGASKFANELEKSINEQEQLNEEKKQNPYAINQEVTVEGITWKVLSAEDKGNTLKAISPYGDNCVSNSGKYIQVKVSLQNDTNEMKSTIGLNLYDDEGREYISSSDVFGCVEEEFFLLDNINPGIRTEFIQTYEVPDEASNLVLKVTDLNLFSDKHEYIGLSF